MPLVAVVLVGAILVGYLLGGRFRNIEALRLRWWGLAIAGYAMQLIPVPQTSSVGRGFGVGLLIASFPLLIAFCIVNIRIAGVAVILAGLLLNFAVIVANQGMPITRHAIEQADQLGRIDRLERHKGAKHYLAKPSDITLEPLADVIGIPNPFGDVVSVGDCVIYEGVFWLIVAAMRGRPTLGRKTRNREAEPARS